MKHLAKVTLLAAILVFFVSSATYGAENRVEFSRIAAVINYLGETYTSQYVKLQDLRIAPVIMNEKWQETPWEATASTPENQIVPDLKKIGQFKNATDALVTQAICVSVSAEIIPVTKQPLLTVTLSGKIYSGQFFANELVQNHNQKLIHVFSDLLKNTTFTPQIRGESEKGEASPRGKNWITNLRVDSDGRVQVAGYGLDLPAITQLAVSMENNDNFTNIFLHNLTRNVYKKTPVWRFDMSFKVN